MLVLLRDKNEKGERDSAYKAPDGKYYSSQDAYEKIQRDKSYWNKSLETLGNILGYTKEQKFPTILPKKLSDLRKGYGSEAIYETIVRQNNAIEYAIQHKTFQNEYARCSYIASILVNSINDVYREMKHKEAVKQVVSSDDHEYVPEDFEDIGNKNSDKRDISSLFKGEEWM